MQGHSALEDLTIALPVKMGHSAMRAPRCAKVAVLASTAAMLRSHAQTALLVHTVGWVRLLVKLVLLGPAVPPVLRSVQSVMLEDMWCSQATLAAQYARRAPQALEGHQNVYHVRVDSSVQQVPVNVSNVTLASLQLMLSTARIALREPGVALHLPVARLVSMAPKAMPRQEPVRFAQQEPLWCSQIKPVKYVLLADMPMQVLLFVKFVKLANTATNHPTAALTALQGNLAVSHHLCA